MEEEILPFLAKVSTANSHENHVLCIYTPYPHDFANVRNVYLQIIALGIVPATEMIKYKTDEQQWVVKRKLMLNLYSSTIMNEPHFSFASALKDYIAHGK